MVTCEVRFHYEYTDDYGKRFCHAHFRVKVSLPGVPRVGENLVITVNDGAATVDGTVQSVTYHVEGGQSAVCLLTESQRDNVSGMEGVEWVMNELRSAGFVVEIDDRQDA